MENNDFISNKNSKLKKFDKNKKQKRILIGSVIGVLLIVGTIILYKTYAFYETKKEFNVIKGQVPEFSKEDIQLSWYIGDEKQTGPFPVKNGGYSGVSVSCENGATAEWSNSIWGLVNINPNNNKKVYCNVVFESGNTIADNDLKPENIACGVTIFGITGKNGTFAECSQVGDLVSYTPPTGRTYNVPTEWTGLYSQTIHPEYNKLWRIIKKNADGTVDIISEYTSYEGITFSGKEGYRLLVDGLNNIANLYIDDNYIQSARHMGYNGQTGSLSTTARAIAKATTGSTAPFETTSNNDNETVGGGDIMYQADTESPNGLVYQTYKTYRGSSPSPLAAYQTNPDGTGSTTQEIYWLASRKLYNGSSNWSLSGRIVLTGGSVYERNLWNSGSNGSSWSNKIRVVLTLKSGLSITEDNTGEAKWKIN